jgi:hypothetical protein
MTAVTDRPKRYRAPHRARPESGRWVYCCLGCSLIDISDRRDQATCSPRCRVRLCRDKFTQRMMADMDIGPAGLAHSMAVRRLADAGVAGAAEVEQGLKSGAIKGGAELQDAIFPIWCQAVADHLNAERERNASSETLQAKGGAR